MTSEELKTLVADCPRLYHMAMRQSWPSIKAHGLLPTKSLLELFEVDHVRRQELTTKRRPASVKITHPVHGDAVIRDQIPMHDRHLESCLQGGLTVREWHDRLNERVFFWLTEQRLEKLLCAKSYRDQEHVVLTLETAPLIADHFDRIELCPMNSGCTMPFPHPRGAGTFLPIPSYPYAEWRSRRRALEAVVELTVIGGVPNVADYVLEVSARKCGEILGQIYQRP